MKNYILTLGLTLVLVFVGDYIVPNGASANVSFNVDVLITLCNS